jgi:hypothetical protein
MDRRKSFAQDSVPNAHKGSDHTAQFVMIAVFVLFIIASFILARLSA